MSSSSTLWIVQYILHPHPPTSTTTPPSPLTSDPWSVRPSINFILLFSHISLSSQTVDLFLLQFRFCFFLVVIFWCALTWSVSTPVFSLKQSSRALVDYHNSRTGNATEVSSTKSLETFLAAWEQLEAADTIINLNSETSNELSGLYGMAINPR